MIYGPESIDEPDARVGERAEQELGALLDYLLHERGFDFSGHKRPSLTRRVRRRMTAVGVDSVRDYVLLLERTPDELAQLVDLLLINVTSFFRDPAAWQALAGRLPAIVDRRSDAPIRVWSAGCSSGEEPYTLAMVLCEALGEDAFARRVKIYATDIDEEALSLARLATYSPKALEHVPSPLVERYFSPSGADFVFRKDLRRDIVFGRHDVLKDAPIPRVDVLVCRNLLMYFNAETQERLLERLQPAFNPGGVLFLGKAEMLLSHSKLFTPVDLKLRLFSRAPRAARGRPTSRVGHDEHAAERDPDESSRARLRASFSDAGPIAQILVDPAGCIVSASRKAAKLFSLGAHDVGRPLAELASGWVDLLASFERARIERRAVQLKDVERVLASGEKLFFDVDVTPLPSGPGALAGAQLTFLDVTQARRLRVELRRANLELEAAHEELRATRLELRGLNEELQSTNEELETTNEELQSTNEELESMNEELESTNEELQTINEELRQRGTELNQALALFDAVLGGLHVGVAVLDRELRVFTWSPRMSELVGVRPRDAAGKHFASLEGRLPFSEIAASLRAALDERKESTRTIDGEGSHGDALKLEVRVSPLRGDGMRGVIVLVGEVS